MKIVLLCDHYYPYIGGAEVVNKQIAEHFSKKHEVVVISKNFRGAGDNSVSIINGVKIYRTADVPRAFHSVTAYVCGMKLARDADIIFSATYASGLAGYWLGKKLKKKSIILVYEILGEHWQFFKRFYFLYYWYERYIVTRPFNHFIVFSNYTKHKLQEYHIDAARISVIYQGVDENIFYPRPVDLFLRKSIAGEAPFVYLYFGRPGGSKGLPYLINAVPLIANAIPGSKLVAILSRETQAEYHKLHRLIDKVNAKYGEKIIVIDSVPHNILLDYITIADVVVIPSLSEGFGFAAVESCMLGKKVVVTDTGSLPEVVFGQVVKVKKADAAAIAEGVIRAYHDECESIPPKKFNWEDALKQYENIIYSISSR